MFFERKLTVKPGFIEKPALFAIIGYIIIRYIMPIFSSSLNEQLSSIIIFAGTYIFNALLIYIHRKTLKDFNIGFLSLTIFIAAPLLGFINLLINLTAVDRNFPVATPVIRIIIEIIIGTLLCFLLLRSKVNINKEKWTWILIGIFSGIIFGIIIGFIDKIGRPLNEINSPKLSLIILVQSLLMQLYSAPLCEEPFFRGVLWGYLKKFGWAESKIWLFQALLFTLAHFYYINEYPIRFWIALPVSSLVFGFLVWKTKSILPSIFAHAFFNSIADLVSCFTF